MKPSYDECKYSTWSNDILMLWHHRWISTLAVCTVHGTGWYFLTLVAEYHVQKWVVGIRLKVHEH